MCLVYIEPVYPQFFKGDHIVFLVFRPELFQPGFQLLSGTFHLLDGEPLSIVGFRFGNSVNDFINLILKQFLLPGKGNGNLLKLTVANDHSVIIAGGDPGAELFPVFLFKVFLGGHQQLGGRIQAKEFAGPLFR